MFEMPSIPGFNPAHSRTMRPLRTTVALGLALVVRIRETYGSIEEDEILADDMKTAAKGHQS